MDGIDPTDHPDIDFPGDHDPNRATCDCSGCRTLMYREVGGTRME